jgi:hypothetical protein
MCLLSILIFTSVFVTTFPSHTVTIIPNNNDNNDNNDDNNDDNNNDDNGDNDGDDDYYYTICNFTIEIFPLPFKA